MDLLQHGVGELVEGRLAAEVAGAMARLRERRVHGPFDGVLHFAGSIQVAESMREPLAYYRNNVSASVVLLEACVREGVSSFVFSSSAAVYGHPEAQPLAKNAPPAPLSEDAPLAPLSPYGASKAMVERMLADSAAAHGLRYAALRYFNAAGADPAALKEARVRRAACARRAAALRRRLDDLPGRAELAEYQARFVELADQVRNGPVLAFLKSIDSRLNKDVNQSRYHALVLILSIHLAFVFPAFPCFSSDFYIS